MKSTVASEGGVHSDPQEENGAGVCTCRPTRPTPRSAPQRRSIPGGRTLLSRRRRLSSQLAEGSPLDGIEPLQHPRSCHSVASTCTGGVRGRRSTPAVTGQKPSASAPRQVPGPDSQPGGAATNSPSASAFRGVGRGASDVHGVPPGAKRFDPPSSAASGTQHPGVARRVGRSRRTGGWRWSLSVGGTGGANLGL